MAAAAPYAALLRQPARDNGEHLVGIERFDEGGFHAGGAGLGQLRQAQAHGHDGGARGLLAQHWQELEAARVWQDEVQQAARQIGFDVLRLGTDRTQREVALVEFVAERRLRRR